MKLSQKSYILLDKRSYAMINSMELLSDTLKGSLNSELLFMTAKTCNFLSEGFDELRAIFNMFGTHIKHISLLNEWCIPFSGLTASNRISFIHRIVTSWCPALTSLEIEIKNDNTLPSIFIINLDITETLKLQQVFIRETPDCVISSSMLNYTTVILRNSPALKTLAIELPRERFCYREAPLVYKFLLQIPFLADQISEFHFDMFETRRQNESSSDEEDEEDLPQFGPFKLPSPFLQFMSSLTNLRKLFIRGKVCSGRRSLILPNGQYLCSKLKKTLTYLELTDVCCDQIKGADDNVFEEQEMTIINFIETCPNLVELKINAQDFEDSTTLFFNLSDLLKIKMAHLTRLTVTDHCGRLNLEKLNTSDKFAWSFPNLQYLKLENMYEWNAFEMKYEPCDIVQLLVALRKLPKLKELTILACVKDVQKVPHAMIIASCFEGLTKFSLSVFWDDVHNTLSLCEMFTTALLSIRSRLSIFLHAQTTETERNKINSFAVAKNVDFTLRD